MNTPFLEVRAGYLELQAEIDAAISRVLRSGVFIRGEEVRRFEEEFAQYCGSADCVGVANGGDALTLALRALGIGPNDEVIVPANTFIATWLAVSQCGAIPVPVEASEATANIDSSRVEAAITERSKAIVPVHLYGQPADLDPLLELAQRYRLRVVEDAAQAHGARYKGKRIGAHGDAVAWSFYPGKNLGAFGDAGAVTSDDRALIERIRVLGNYGAATKNVHLTRGVSSRLDPIHAAVLRAKLRSLDDWNERRRKSAARYQSALTNVDLTLPFVPRWAEPAWHVYAIRSSNRNAVQQALYAVGVECLIHYPTPPYLQPAYADFGIRRGRFPVTERISASTLSLPIGPHMNAAHIEHVIDRVTSICGRAAVLA